MLLPQATLVNMEDFLPVLEAAFEDAGIPRRDPDTIHIAEYSAFVKARHPQRNQTTAANCGIEAQCGYSAS